MKAKHIITTCGVILGGLAISQSASAVVTYKTQSDVQFTFAPMLTLSLSEDGFSIAELVPGTSAKSNEVTAKVTTNSVAGYTLSATVGNSSYDTTNLMLDKNNYFSMIGSDETTLSKGKWGYTLDDGTTYGALSTTTGTVLYKSIDMDGTPAGGYSQQDASKPTTTTMKIGAYATDNQAVGVYNNVVNFAVVSNISTRSVKALVGNGAATAAPASGDYNEGETINITATCNADYTFSNWTKSFDTGTIADPTAANTTYTVGGGDVILTANCVANS